MALDRQALCDRFRRDGFVIVRKVFDPCRLESLRHAVTGLEDHRLPWRLKYAGHAPSVRERSNIFARVDEARHLLERSEVLLLVRDLIGEDLYLFRDAYVEKLPNPESRFPLHQDSEFWDIQPEALVSLWIPLQDSDARNGVLQVVPESFTVRLEHYVRLSDTVRAPKLVNRILRRGAHNTEERGSGRARRALSNAVNGTVLPFVSRHFRPAQRFAELFVAEGEAEWWTRAVTPALKLGDCIVYHSRTLHGSRGNSDQKSRVAYIPTFMGRSYTRDGIPVADPRFGYPEVPVTGCA